MNLQQLERLNQDTIFEVYTDINTPEDFYVGYIKEVYNKFVMLESYNREAEFNGFRFLRNTDIFKIQKDTQYLSQYLNTVFPRNNSQSFSLKDGGMLEVLEWCEKYNKLIELITIWEDEIVGTIESLEEGLVIINAFSPEDFKQDGQCIIDNTDIIEVSMETKQLKFVASNTSK